MEFKKLIIVLTITVISMFSLLLGLSYAWYAYKNAQTSISGSTISVAPSVIFSETEYINTTSTMPILDADRYNYADKTSFTITFDENLSIYETGLSITLTDIVIDDALKTSNYKYELVENDTIIASGNFASLGDSTELTLLPMTIKTPEKYPYSYAYHLYLWLCEDGTNQNELMNKQVSAKISVVSANKKVGK